MMRLKTVSTLAILVGYFFVAFFPKAVLAQDSPTGFVAFGAAAQPDYEGSEDYEAGPFLAARIAFGETQLELEGLAGRLDISRIDGFGFGPAFRYRFGRDNDVDNIQVAALPEIDDAVELGFFLRYGQPIGLASGDEGVLRVDLLYDVADAHSGFLAELGAAYTFRPTPRLGLTAGVSTRYVSDDYADTYFSISNVGSMASGLPAFKADGGFDSIGVSLVATYQLTESWGLIANASVSALMGDASDSPIVSDVGSETQAFFGLGVTYSF